MQCLTHKSKCENPLAYSLCLFPTYLIAKCSQSYLIKARMNLWEVSYVYSVTIQMTFTLLHPGWQSSMVWPTRSPGFCHTLLDSLLFSDSLIGNVIQSQPCIVSLQVYFGCQNCWKRKGEWIITYPPVKKHVLTVCVISLSIFYLYNCFNQPTWTIFFFLSSEINST